MFSRKLFSELRKPPASNLVFSPFSASTVSDHFVLPYFFVIWDLEQKDDSSSCRCRDIQSAQIANDDQTKIITSCVTDLSTLALVKNQSTAQFNSFAFAICCHRQQVHCDLLQVLAMLAEGAEGNTLKQMRQGLAIPGGRFLFYFCTSAPFQKCQNFCTLHISKPNSTRLKKS